MRHRNPDLVILNYGTNESGFAAFLTREYEKELREAIRRVRAALPNASILVMSPMDRGQKNGGEIETLPTIPRIVEIQRRVAAELRCGFFNTFEAMGGAGTMARWYDNQPRLVSADFIHPTPAGAHIVATAFVRELTSRIESVQIAPGAGSRTPWPRRADRMLRSAAIALLCLCGRALVPQPSRHVAASPTAKPARQEEARQETQEEGSARPACAIIPRHA